MKEVILCKYGEIILKGANKAHFEALLLREIKRRAKHIGNYSVRYAQSTVFIEPEGSEAIDAFDDMYAQIKKVFGFASVTRAAACEKTLDAILKTCAEYLPNKLDCAKTFKCEAKRSDKAFPLKSPELAAEAGGAILEALPGLKVKMDDPDVTVRIEVREKEAYIHAGQDRGAGGIPIGSSGRALLLLSGGIDSPVAGYMMARRGMKISAVHFESPPYTSERARQKVEKLARLVSRYSGKMTVFVVQFTDIQEHIRRECKEDLFTLIMRRFMMRIAERIAERGGCKAIVTGENLGQVASQTMEAMACTQAVTDLPVLQPLIGMDKEDIIRISRKIGTFETSILPYEDCCTVFTPRHPKTKPHVEDVAAAESVMDVEGLVNEALEGIERIWIDIEG